TGAEPLAAEQAPVVAACKVITQEFLLLNCRSIDILTPPPGSTLEQDLLNVLTAELVAQPPDLTVAYRDGQRLVQRYRAERLEPVAGGVPSRLRPGGVYLITGGLGGIGLHLAQYLAQTVRAKLVLIGRSGLPDRDTWPAWLTGHAEDDSVSRKIQKIQELEALGAEVLVLSAD